MDRQVSISCDGKDVPLNDFAAEIVANTVSALVGSLKKSDPAAEILVRRKEELAQLMTREMGKVLKESQGDVQEAIDMLYYTAGEGRRLYGESTPSELPDTFAMTAGQDFVIQELIIL